MAHKRINLLDSQQTLDTREKYSRWLHRGVLLLGIIVLSLLGGLLYFVRDLRAKEASLQNEKKVLIQRQVQLADVVGRAQRIETTLTKMRSVTSKESDYKKYVILLSSLLPEATTSASISSLQIKEGNVAELTIHTNSSESTQEVLMLFEREELKKQFKKFDITRLVEADQEDKTQSTDLKISLAW